LQLWLMVNCHQSAQNHWTRWLALWEILKQLQPICMCITEVPFMIGYCGYFVWSICQMMFCTVLKSIWIMNLLHIDEQYLTWKSNYSKVCIVMVWKECIF
jgi:hypothetical protein